MQRQHKTVSIVIAIFQPQLEWLEQLLWSIQKQTFQDYEVILMDDGSGQESFASLSEIVQKVFGRRQHIRLLKSKKNEGSNKTFEKLVLCAEGDYIAFCDQDDIWEPKKLQMLVQAIQRKNAVIAYSDMSVIDKNGCKLYASLRQMRKHLHYVSGKHLTARYIIDNCTAACSMLVKREEVLKTLPFYEGVYCDQWICALVAASGSIVFVDVPLVKYRRHGKNQTGLFYQIRNRQDYYEQRILPAYHMVKEIRKRGIHYKYESDMIAFVQARKNGNVPKIWKYRRFCIKYAYFDLLLICMPDTIVKYIFCWLRHVNAR